MSSLNIWEGPNIRLRAVEPEDLERYQSFDEDSEMARSGWWIPFPRSNYAGKQWIEKAALEDGQDDAFRFTIEAKEHGVIGSMNTLSCERRNGTFKYGIAIGREYWGRGYAKEAIRLVLRYYFEELRYQKVTVHIYAFNERSIKLHESLGFQHEGQLRRMIFTGGEYHDEVLMGLTKEEFEEHSTRM
jgi:RimJ/RimL family protein N-acetyltransferase